MTLRTSHSARRTRKDALPIGRVWTLGANLRESVADWRWRHPLAANVLGIALVTLAATAILIGLLFLVGLFLPDVSAGPPAAAPPFPSAPAAGPAVFKSGSRNAEVGNLATRGNPAGPTGAVRAGAPASSVFSQASGLGPSASPCVANPQGFAEQGQAGPESGIRFGWVVVAGIGLVAWMFRRAVKKEPIA
jgi:hypothetical protein